MFEDLDFRDWTTYSILLEIKTPFPPPNQVQYVRRRRSLSAPTYLRTHDMPARVAPPPPALKPRRRHSLIPASPPRVPSPPPALTYKPLSYPWTIPQSALYIESSLDATSTLIAEAIAAHSLSGQRANGLSLNEAINLLVTSGHFVVTTTGIHRADSHPHPSPHNTHYVLRYNGQRNDNEKEYTPKIGKWETIGVPIVAKREMRWAVAGKGKKVRFLDTCLKVDGKGVWEEGGLSAGDGEMWRYDCRWMEGRGRRSRKGREGEGRRLVGAKGRLSCVRMFEEDREGVSTGRWLSSIN